MVRNTYNFYCLYNQGFLYKTPQFITHICCSDQRGIHFCIIDDVTVIVSLKVYDNKHAKEIYTLFIFILQKSLKGVCIP